MNDWIYCKDKLPEKHKYYLVSWLNGGTPVVDMARFNHKGKWSEIELAFDIYAYQPLPDPAPLPEEADDG